MSTLSSSKFVSYDELAAMLCITRKTLRNRLSAYPESLPTPVRFPGAKSPVWHPEVVAAWMHKLRNPHIFSSSNTPILLVASPADKPVRKRGRPSNATLAAEGRLA